MSISEDRETAKKELSLERPIDGFLSGRGIMVSYRASTPQVGGLYPYGSCGVCTRYPNIERKKLDTGSYGVVPLVWELLLSRLVLCSPMVF